MRTEHPGAPGTDAGIVGPPAFPRQTRPRLKCPFPKLRPAPSPRDDAFFMALAHDQAIEAWRADEVPVGAILVSPDGSTVLAAAHNRVESRRDATAHAEMLAIARACARVRNQRLNGCVLYVTKEPCPMCAGAGILARLARVVFAVRDPKAGCLGGAAAIHTLPGLNHRLEVAHGVLEAECLALLRSYFQLKRSAPGASRAPHPPRGARPD